MQTFETNAIISALEINLKRHTPQAFLQDVYEYALLPPGKLFRPMLAWAMASDFQAAPYPLGNTGGDLELFCCALEVHHAYTLIHDDLPAMDNDDYRRGKLTVHKKFGQWQAILAGDGLLNLSYRLLAMMERPNNKQLIKIFAWAMGPKGLIHGQAMDLGQFATKGINEILHIHTLKTGRLIQLALLGGIVIGKNGSLQFSDVKIALRLGETLGILFQLLDDLNELADSNLPEHEMMINPWLKWPEQALNLSLALMLKLQKNIQRYELNYLKQSLAPWLKKNQEQIIKNKLPEKFKILPLMQAFDAFKLG